MPSWITSLVVGAIGAGSVATAIAAPLSLSNNNTEQRQTEKRDVDSGRRAEEQRDSTSHQEIQTPVIQQEKKETINFKEDCYGNFLKQDGRGELVVCLEDKSKDSVPLFYMRWTDNREEKFAKVEEINVADPRVSFVLKGQTGQKVLDMGTKHKTITVLQVSKSTIHELKERCKESRLEGDNYHLVCKYWNGGEYTQTATKLT